MSKAARIRKLLHLSNDEIVSRTGISKPYVRAVRQRTDGDGNPIRCPAEMKWLADNRDTYRAYHRVYMRQLRQRTAGARP